MVLTGWCMALLKEKFLGDWPSLEWWAGWVPKRGRDLEEGKRPRQGCPVALGLF